MTHVRCFFVFRAVHYGSPTLPDPPSSAQRGFDGETTRNKGGADVLTTILGQTIPRPPRRLLSVADFALERVACRHRTA